MSAKRLHKGSGSVDPTSLACETCLFVGLAPASLAVSKMDSTSYTALSWSTCPAGQAPACEGQLVHAETLQLRSCCTIADSA